MNNKELLEKYPWLKFNSNIPEKYSDFELYTCWADMILSGWAESFGEFFLADLDSALRESYPEGIPEDFHILDIKEKWGQLTVYLSEEPVAVADVLYLYEYISSFVCIVCGAPYPFAHMTYDGWVMPLCEKCYIGKSSDEFVKYHEYYLQTVLKDSITLFEGPQEYINITTHNADGERNERRIRVKGTWDKIVQSYVQKTII